MRVKAVEEFRNSNKKNTKNFPSDAASNEWNREDENKYGLKQCKNTKQMKSCFAHRKDTTKFMGYTFI